MNRKTLLRRMVITGFIIAMLCFTMFFVFTNAMSVTAGSGPVIDSVSPISAMRLQTITISGRGFGDIQPVIRTLSDGSVNTVGGGKNMPGTGGTPVIQVNNYARNTWGSGVQDAPWTAGCAIGIFLEKWSDTEIVLGGFGSALSTTGQGVWNIKPGDPMRVVIITPNGIATYDTTVVSNGTEPAPTSSPMPNQSPPIISSVSPISPTRLQTICITGSGFGIIPPQMIGLSDGTVNTKDGVYTPTIQIRDNALRGEWTAGRQGDAIGIIIVDWTDNQITLGGFGTALGTHSDIPWSIMSGDPIDIMIWTSGGTAKYSTVVSGSDMAASSSAPEITSVTPITNQQKQTITIRGHGFGNIQPELLDLDDGSVDTVWGENTPSIVVYDKTNLLSAGATGDWNGFTNGPPDLIGIILVSWTDTQIVLGGFGSGLGSRFSWSQVSEGDDIQIQIQTASGFATYDLVASGDGSSSPPPSSSSLDPSYISIMAEPLSTVAGSPVNVFGTLTDTNGDALQNKTIVLSYIFSGLDSWIPISSDLTDEQGKYAIQWVNSASGTFTLKAEWSGDETNNGTSNQTSLCFLPCQNQQTFIFESNSTIYDLNFNAAASSLTFNVTGPSGTTGYVKVTIAKSLVANAADIKVYLDKNQLNCEVTSNADSWLLAFTYTQSTHNVMVSFATNRAKTTFLGIELWIGIGGIIIVAIGASFLLYFKKRKH